MRRGGFFSREVASGCDDAGAFSRWKHHFARRRCVPARGASTRRVLAARSVDARSAPGASRAGQFRPRRGRWRRAVAARDAKRPGHGRPAKKGGAGPWMAPGAAGHGWPQAEGRVAAATTSAAELSAGPGWPGAKRSEAPAMDGGKSCGAMDGDGATTEHALRGRSA